MTTVVDSPTVESSTRHRRLDIRPNSRGPVLAWQLATGVAILGCWQVASQVGIIPSLLNAAPREVFVFLGESVGSGELWPNLTSTLEAALAGFVLASTAGILAGIGLALAPGVERVMQPYLNALNSMPRIALGPILIAFFGIGQAPKIALACTLVFFIMLTNAAAGIQSADKDVLDLMKAHGATKRQLFVKVLLPVATPSIVAGLRLGMTYSLLGVITAEMLSSREGIGQLILFYSQTFTIEGVYAMLLVLAVVAALLDGLIGQAEVRLFRWRPPASR